MFHGIAGFHCVVLLTQEGGDEVMAALHAVYRCEVGEDCRWRGYVVADDASVEADSLPEARHQLHTLLASRVEAWPFDGVVEHTEHPLGDKLWLREALDERVAARGHTARVAFEALHDQRVRARLAALPPAYLGGIVIVACVPGDTIRWVLDQHDENGALVVATPVSNHRVWWNALVTPTTAEAHGLMPQASLDELDLLDPEATVDDWAAHTDCGHLVTLAAVPTVSAPIDDTD